MPASEMIGFVSLSYVRHMRKTRGLQRHPFVGDHISSFRSLPSRRASMHRVIVTCASDDQLAVMVNGIPGKMASSTAEEVLRRGLVLAEEALTGPGMDTDHEIDATKVRLIAPDGHLASLNRMRDKYPRLIVVDYTHPSAANVNVDSYSQAGLSFVIGTTGGDVAAMKKAVHASDVYAVIAPNMGKQIVAFQAMMEMMARQFPGAFSGYTLSVKESHQANKADTSGTAKSVVSSFTNLGLDFQLDEIQKVRDPSRSENEMHVPAEFVSSGHAFHTYHLTSPDGTVNFEFQHNVCGRNTYASGTVDAVQFLDGRKQSGDAQHIYDMIGILSSGEMS